MATIFGTDGNIFTIDLDGTGKTYLTDDPTGVLNSTASWSYDASQIVYTRTLSGGPQLDFFDVGYIWRMNADGSDKRQLTSGVLYGSLATFSPDGTKILFTSIATGSPELWLMNADGSEPHPLTDTTGAEVARNGRVIRWSTNASYSPDGSKIAYASTESGRSEIWVMNADGTGATQLTSSDAANAPDANAPMWAPDGSKIAFWSGFVRETGDIFTINPDGSDRQQVTFDSPAANDDNPSWLPNSAAILFNTDRDAATTGAVDTWIVNADGSGKRPLFAFAVGDQSRLPITSRDAATASAAAANAARASAATASAATLADIVGAAGDTDVGGSGITYIDALAGSQSVVAGAAATTVQAGHGDTVSGGSGPLQLYLDSDAATTTVSLAPGHAAALLRDVSIAGGAGGSIDVSGFVAATDVIQSKTSVTPSGSFLGTSAADGNGGTVLTFVDGTRMVLSGIADPGKITFGQ